MIDKEVEDVRNFHNKFDILDAGTTPTMLTKRKLKERIECMQEELDEFKKAVDEQDFAEQADALIDLVYFAKGTAVMMGLPWAALWDDVQRANMDKVRGVGKRGHAVDMIKPEGWQKPNGTLILEAAGFDKSAFETNGQITEAKCSDDSAEHKYFAHVQKMLSAANQIPIGDNMTAPVGLFDQYGNAIIENTLTNVDPSTVYATVSRKIPLSALDDLDTFIDPEIAYVHMYTVMVPMQMVLGEMVDVTDPITFETKQMKVTEDMFEASQFIIARYGRKK